jgi:hypothetical protein
MPAQRPEPDGENHAAATQDVLTDPVIVEAPVTLPMAVTLPMPVAPVPVAAVPGTPVVAAAPGAAGPVAAAPGPAPAGPVAATPAFVAPVRVPPGSERPAATMPGRHLEDPEWTRALLALAADMTPGREVPLAWLIRASDACAFVESATPAPAPFTATPAGSSWSIAKDSRLVDHVTPSAAILASRRSGLVTLWRDEQSRCLLDIVQARSLVLDGPPVAVGFTLSDIVVELATRRWCDLEDVYLVGFGREMHGLENVRYLPSAGDAVDLLAEVDPFEERLGRCFVVAPTPMIEGQGADLRKLLRLVDQIPLTGLVCCDTSVHAHCTWHVASHRQTLRMEVTGRAGPSAVLSPEQWVERTGVPVQPLVRSLRAEIAPVLDAQRPPMADAGLVPSTSDLTDDRPAPDGVEVLVLGPVQVAGALESLEGRPRLTELVVYLALHPEGSTSESFAAALWPERRVPPQTLANRLHETRRALGSTPAGVPRLQRSEGRHLLAPDVSTDWSRFRRLTETGSGPASWRQALSIVRGRPFEGLARGEWTVFEGHVAAIESAVVDVAARLGEHLLGAGDPLGAEWALRRGLAVAPWDERLYRLRMAAADQLGNRGGVESVLRSLAQALDWRGDPLKIVHPETAALYRRLTDDTGPGQPGQPGQRGR